MGGAEGGGDRAAADLCIQLPVLARCRQEHSAERAHRSEPLQCAEDPRRQGTRRQHRGGAGRPCNGSGSHRPLPGHYYSNHTVLDCLCCGSPQVQEAIRDHLDTYYWVDPGTSCKGLCYRRPCDNDHAGPTRLWESFKTDNPAAYNYNGVENEREYTVDGGQVLGGLRGVRERIPDYDETVPDPRVSVKRTWKFGANMATLSEATFHRYIAKYNKEDLCKMLGCAKDHCKCPHCKDMESDIVTTHRDKMRAAKGAIADASPTYAARHVTALVDYRAHMQKDITMRAWINGWKYFGRAARIKWRGKTDGDKAAVLNATVAAVAAAAADDGNATAAAAADTSSAAAAGTAGATRLVAAASSPKYRFAPIIYGAHGDDASDRETPQVPVTVTGMFEKVPSHLGGHHDLITDVAKLILREPGSGTNDSDAVIDEVWMNLIAGIPEQRPQVIILENDCGPLQLNQHMAHMLKMLVDQHFCLVAIGAYHEQRHSKGPSDKDFGSVDRALGSACTFSVDCIAHLAQLLPLAAARAARNVVGIFNPESVSALLSACSCLQQLLQLRLHLRL